MCSADFTFLAVTIYSVTSHFYPPPGADRGVRLHTDDMDVFGAKERRRQAGLAEAGDMKSKADGDV